MKNRQSRQNNITNIIGHKGDGKTVLTEILALINDKPVIIADPRFQYPSEPRRRLYFHNPRALALWLANIDNFKMFYNFKLELICACDVNNFEMLAGTVYKMQNVLFVVDELDMFYNTRTSDKSNINKILQYGRHNLIDCIFTSRRPANIGRNATASADEFYLSKIVEPIDLLYAKNLGLDDASIKTLQTLPRFSFLHIKDNHKSIIKTDKKMIDKIDKL